MLRFPVLVTNFCLALSLLLNSVTIHYIATKRVWLLAITAATGVSEGKALRLPTQ